jgi:hypothetical protein
MNPNPLRKYVHDLANSLSIADASLSRGLKLLAEKLPSESEELKRLLKTEEALRKSIETLRELRQTISSDKKWDD